MVFMVDQKGVSSKVEKSKDRFAVAMIVLAFLLIGMSESLVEFIVENMPKGSATGSSGVARLNLGDWN